MKAADDQAGRRKVALCHSTKTA